jgi:sarcosine oxidase
VPLVVKTGGLDLEPPDVNDLASYANGMRAAEIPFEELTADEVMYRWPQYRLDGGERALYQADGGLVDSGKGIAAHVALARAHGATVLDQTPARAIRVAGNGVEVETDAGTFTAGKVIIAADAWTNQLLASFGISWPLTILQEQVTFFATPNLRDFAPDRFPIFIWHGTDYYGFPVYGEVATKAAID